MACSSSSRNISFDTSFGSARIRWDGPRATLFLDDVESPAVNTSDPTYLEFEYMQHMDAVVSSLWGPQDRFRALHVGDAVYVLACAWSSSRPNSRHIAVEIDRPLAGQAREHSPIPGVPQAKIRIDDERAVLDGARKGSFDVIARDALALGVTPDRLRTVGCTNRARRAPAASGVYLVNCAHEGPANARQDVTALQEAFPFVVSIQGPKVGRGGRHGNVVTLASIADAVDADQVDQALRTLALPARTTRPADLTRWVAGTRVLTDSLVGYPQAD